MKRQRQMAHSIIHNRYELKSLLGSGGMGEVHRAYDRLTRTTVALKRVINLADEPDNALQLAQEFQLLASLSHPNIISVLDYGFDAERVPFFTMPLLENHVPITVGAQGRSVEERIDLLIQLFEALAYLHRRRVLHRDLKPNNVLMMPDGQVKVVDFGVATLERNYQTRIAGTILYIAPEVLRDERPTYRSDLYSAGVLAYEVLTGEHPFAYDNVSDLLSSILGSTPRLDNLPTLDEQDLQETFQLISNSTLDLDPFPEGELTEPNESLNPLHVIVQRLMRKDPTERYASATIVIDEWRAALGYPPAPETIAVRESYLQAADFVGRDDDLAQLLVGLDGIWGVYPRGYSFLIGGESGVGKSRLLDELRVRALVKGTQVVVGRGAATGGTRYNYWSEAVRRLLISTPVEDREAAVLKQLVPDIEDLLGRPIDDPPALSKTAAQDQLKAMIIMLFQRQTTPTLLLLEDLHWAVESLQPLKDLADDISKYPLLVVGTYRNDERPDLPNELPNTRHILLPRFNRAAIQALSTSMIGDVGSRSDVLDFLQRETEGNAYFIIETMRTLAQEAGRLRDVGRFPLPQSIQVGGVQAVLQRRLDTVPAYARGLLNVAAVIARQFDLDVLRDIARANNLLAMDIETWLADCSDAAVIELKDGQWQFVHEKLREAIVAAIPEDERRHLHQQVAEALERLHPDPTIIATPIMRQWRAAGDIEQEARYTLIAARQNFAASEFDVTVLQARRVLEILPDTAHYAAQRTDAEVVLGTALASSGQWDAAEAILTKALSAARATNDDSVLIPALTELGSLLIDRDRFAEAEAFVGEAITRAEDSTDGYGLAYALSTMGSVYLEQGDAEPALDHFKRSLDIGRNIGDTWTVARALNNLGNAYIALDQPLAAKATYEESLMLWRELGSRRGVAAAINNLGVVTDSLGEFAAAAEYYREGLAMSRDNNDTLSVCINCINLGWVLLKLKQTNAAAPLLHEALVEATEMEIGVLQLFSVLGIAWLRAPNNALISANWYGACTQHPDADTDDHHFEDVVEALGDHLDSFDLNDAIALGTGDDFNTIVASLLGKD